MTATSIPVGSYYRWQLDGQTVLAKLLGIGREHQLPPLTWTLAPTGAITGEASVLDGHAAQRAAVTAWAAHLGATVTETERADDRHTLHAFLSVAGTRVGALRAELHPDTD
ncbi:hypothetical protein ACQ5JZ_05405 [Streptomyces sp. ZG43]|uniref:hypothetical protein n=1 Tax=Streptomyces sp. Iso 434 TaxID=3062272 RepID=UPI00397FDE69